MVIQSYRESYKAAPDKQWCRINEPCWLQADAGDERLEQFEKNKIFIKKSNYGPSLEHLFKQTHKNEL